MDMTSTADSSRWYDNPRLGGSPSSNGIGGGLSGGGGHQMGGSGGLGGSGGGGGLGGIGGGNNLDSSDMGAFYALENANHRRYYSSGYAQHGELGLFNVFR